MTDWDKTIAFLNGLGIGYFINETDTTPAEDRRDPWLPCKTIGFEAGCKRVVDHGGVAFIFNIDDSLVKVDTWEV